MIFKFEYVFDGIGKYKNTFLTTENRSGNPPRQGIEVIAKRFSWNLVKNKIIPVKIKAIPINRNDEKVSSIFPLKKKPNNAAGAVATAKYNHIFLYCLLNLRRQPISFLVKIITAISEDRWSTVKKNKSGCEIRFETKAK